MSRLGRCFGGLGPRGLGCCFVDLLGYWFLGEFISWVQWMFVGTEFFIFGVWVVLEAGEGV